MHSWNVVYLCHSLPGSSAGCHSQEWSRLLALSPLPGSCLFVLAVKESHWCCLCSCCLKGSDDHHTRTEREQKVVSLDICIFTRGSCWLLSGTSQNDPPSPPPTMVCPSPKSTCTPLRKPTSLPETRSGYSGFLFLEALAPQSCVKIITVPFFFLLSPQTGNFCSSLWNTTSGILELIFRCVEAFQTKIDA